MSIREMDLIVFSHLRWNFVWQRPQHLMSRFAEHHRIFFIEEPEYSEGGSPRWNTDQPLPNVFVCHAVTPNPEPGFHESQHDLIRGMIESLQASQNIDEYALWFYTPMALPLAENLQPRLVIYDCMNELSGLQNAPVELTEMENQLLQRADVVFTGGPSLFRAKCDRHQNVHCLNSSVDGGHFRQALEEIEEPPGQKDIPHPRLGFFGVIDERFDLALLRTAAEAQPDWQFVMVGPVVKIDPSQLPTNENIHYMGQRSYEDLPKFLKGWDVCLLPFARNEATRFISPTKTLEYMAAEKPIVSTSIVDVAEPYGDIVYLADSPPVFIAACHRAMTASEVERTTRLRRMRDVVARTSWESTVDTMSAELRNCLKRSKDREGLHPSERNAAESWTIHEHKVPVMPRSEDLRR